MTYLWASQQQVMGYLILCILSSAIILTILKWAGIQKLNAFRIILTNYVVATGVALVLACPVNHSHEEILLVLPWAATIGIIFILMFLLVSKTTVISGMTITSIATKMSVVVPVLFSLIYYHESLGLIRLSGFGIALVALVLSVYSRNQARSGLLFWFLPVILFVGNGLLDSLLKFTQAEKLPDFDLYLFNMLVFGSALISGLLLSPWLAFKSTTRKALQQEILLGILLGLVNLGSLVGMIMALRSSLPSSLVFILNNTAVVVLSTIIGILAFREKISKVNLAGILLALVAIVLVSLNL